MSEKSIYINQIGYPEDGIKFAYLYESAACGNTSFVLKDKNGKEVYSGKISAPLQDELAGNPVCYCDFSEYQIKGEYTLCVGEQESNPVKIGTDDYQQLYYSTLRYYYLSRCGQKIEDEKWGHEACHTDIAEIYGTNETKEVTGGWHDAGDYGRYVVAGTKTIMDLLLAYDESKDSFKKFDILDEVRFELEWLLQLQREDGGVYHKISCYHFCGFIMPEAEKDKIVLAPVSTAATCDFAGCLAYAKKYYEDTDKAFADKLMAAAIKAEDYALSHEDEIYSNPPEITTGSYGDWNVTDERYFSLCSMFVATGKEEYLKKALEIRAEAKSKPDNFDEPWKKNWTENFGWGSVGAYGTEILLKNQDKIKDSSIIEDLKKGIIDRAEDALKISKKSGFGLSLGRVFWGSNGAACDEAHLMLFAYDLTGRKEFREAAVKDLDYILGCNPLDLCYVTGNGTNSPVNPHHRPSGFLKSVMPGMLAGGPSAGLQDQEAKLYLQGKAPLCCYIDHTGSYSTNEIAIYWNSPLVYVIAKLHLV